MDHLRRPLLALRRSDRLRLERTLWASRSGCARTTDDITLDCSSGPGALRSPSKASCPGCDAALSPPLTGSLPGSTGEAALTRRLYVRAGLRALDQRLTARFAFFFSPHAASKASRAFVETRSARRFRPFVPTMRFVLPSADCLHEALHRRTYRPAGRRRRARQQTSSVPPLGGSSSERVSAARDRSRDTARSGVEFLGGCSSEEAGQALAVWSPSPRRVSGLPGSGVGRARRANVERLEDGAARVKSNSSACPLVVLTVCLWLLLLELCPAEATSSEATD